MVLAGCHTCSMLALKTRGGSETWILSKGQKGLRSSFVEICCEICEAMAFIEGFWANRIYRIYTVQLLTTSG